MASDTPIIDQEEAKIKNGAQGGQSKEPLNRRFLFVGAGLIALVIIFALASNWSGKKSNIASVRGDYPQVYTLVNDKISKSAPIEIYLPKGISREGGSVSFDPPIKGNWQKSPNADVMVYQPDKSLEVGSHYSVTYESQGGVIKKDFAVDENPEIVDILPQSESEADESSAITIVFSRPMVPLTTLAELESKDLPITLTPPTEGRWKWISTRNLQFIPSNALVASTHYHVEIGEGLTSVEGLSVPPMTHDFTTRPLRLNSIDSSEKLYNKPLTIRFNQPVDLPKTLPNIAVYRMDGAKVALPFEASYGKRSVYNNISRQTGTVEDQSVIEIYPKADKFGRSHLWDFKTSYQAAISRVYPLGGGDITLDNSVSTSFNTTDIVKSYSASSDRSSLAESSLFDPTGQVTVSFYEDADIKSSDVSVKGLDSITYGQKCAETSVLGYYAYAPCVKVEDESTWIFKFKSDAFSLGESFNIELKKIVNADRLAVNTSPINLSLVVYPKLQILKTIPQNGGEGASLSQLILCTNSPLMPLEEKDFYEAVKASDYMVFGRWGLPYKQSNYYYDQNRPCNVGEYVNTINYGLLPQKGYKIDLNLKDDFGQVADLPLSFKTQSAPPLYLRFQSLDKVYNVTTPDKTKLTYAVENFDKVYVTICKTDPVSMVKYLDKNSDIYDSGASFSCIGSKSDVVDIPPKLWVNNYFQIEVSKYFDDPRGQFIVTLTNPRYVDGRNRQMYERSYLSVTNLAVGEKKVNYTKYDSGSSMAKKAVDNSAGDGEIYWVNRLSDLSPVAGANVTLLRDISSGSSASSIAVADISKTDASGIAKLSLYADVVGAAVTTADGDSAVISSWTDNLNYAGTAWAGKKSYIYTDRPIYRPGQEVNIRGIYRLFYDGIYEVYDDVPIRLKVADARGENVFDKDVTVSKYGTFNATFKLPEGAALGYYSVSIDGGYGSFEVEEYKGAAFEAAASTDKDEYIAGDEVNMKVSAKYYFGVPVSGAKVNYSLTAQNYYFDKYSDEYFNFGGGWYYCYDCGYGDSYILSGQATLDENGEAAISQKMDFERLFREDARDQGKIIVLHATMQDSAGNTVSATKSFIVHRGEFYIGAQTDPYFVGTGQPFNLRIKTVDTSGKSVGKNNLKVVINKVEWNSYDRQEVDGGYYSRPERVLTPVWTKTVSTNSKGDYGESINLKDAGSYEIDVTSIDSRGNNISTKSSVYIYGKGSVSVRPTNNATLSITAMNNNLKVGDTAKLIFESPYPKAKALISLERGRIMDYKVVDVNQNVFEYEFKITPEMVPNIFASVLLISSTPETKFGQVEFYVNKETRELNVKVTSDKISYLPGEKVTLQIKTTDYTGKGAPAEVSVAVADLSILALKGNPKKDPLTFFYNGFPLAVTTATNIKNILTEAQIPTGTKGGGGGNAEDLAKKARGEFKDTAFWQADVVTNADGLATVSFTLPDNLTRWQVETLGVTEDTKVGVNYSELTAQKNIMVVPVKPRFAVPGDEFEIGAQIFNQTQVSQSLNVSYRSDTLPLTNSSGDMKLTLKPGDNATVYFGVKAPGDKTTGSHSFTISARNDAFDDTVTNVIPINPNQTFEAVATANSTSDSKASEYIYIPEGVLTERGGLTIKTSATLGVFLSDALNYMVQYPYGCTEQMLSKLSAIAVIQKGLKLPNLADKFSLSPVVLGNNIYSVDDVMSIGLAKVLANQNYDGGFSYYSGLESSLYLSIHTLSSLADVRDAGYSVPNSALTRASSYIVNKLNERGAGYYGVDTYISAAYALSRAGVSEGGLRQIMNAISPYLSKTYINEKAGSGTLAYLAMLSLSGEWGAGTREGIYTSLKNRVTIDSRGAYVKAGSSDYNWQIYETPVSDTALFVKALAEKRDGYSLTDKLLGWILASRAKDGAWGSTANTMTVISALTDYMSWKRETESNFALDLGLDGQKLETYDFNPKSILSIFEKDMPISAFSQGTMHKLSFDKTNRNDLPNNFYYDIGLKYYLPAEDIAPRDEGIMLDRKIYSLTDIGETKPLSEAKVGDVVKGKLTIITAKARHQFSVEDYIPAGFELVNFSLATEDRSSVENPGKGEADTKVGDSTSPSLAPAPKPLFGGVLSPLNNVAASFGVYGDYGNYDSYNVYQSGKPYQNNLYPDYNELRDDRLFLFKDYLPAGEYTYEYYLRATTPGTFRYLPAVASEMYYPENFGRTAGGLFTVTR